MKVYTVSVGDGGDGDAIQLHAVYASEESAKAEAHRLRIEDYTRGGYRTVEEAEEFIVKWATVSYRHHVDEWEVLP